MAESILISISDVQEYRKIDPKFNEDRFNTLASEIQRKNLRDLLGDAMYYDFFENIAAGKYVKLRDGETYDYSGNTIKYYGLKPTLCYWWLSLALRESDLYLSTHGAIQFNNNQQQSFEVAKEKERTAIKYLETATRYSNDIIQYVQTKINDFPLFIGSEKMNQSNFLTFRL